MHFLTPKVLVDTDVARLLAQRPVPARETALQGACGWVECCYIWVTWVGGCSLQLGLRRVYWYMVPYGSDGSGVLIDIFEAISQLYAIHVNQIYIDHEGSCIFRFFHQNQVQIFFQCQCCRAIRPFLSLFLSILQSQVHKGSLRRTVVPSPPILKIWSMEWGSWIVCQRHNRYVRSVGRSPKIWIPTCHSVGCLSWRKWMISKQNDFHISHLQP